jgi:hypothetical protein
MHCQDRLYGKLHLYEEMLGFCPGKIDVDNPFSGKRQTRLRRNDG